MPAKNLPDFEDATKQAAVGARLACLTPPGAGAIATLALEGPRAWSITRALFQGALPEEPSAGRFYLGRFGADNASDEVVLAVKKDGLELHCHGGMEVVRFIEELFVARGAIACSWQELAGHISPLSLLAQEQLQQAPTLKTAAILLDQFQGAFGKDLMELVGHLERNDQAAAGRLVARLAQTQHLGRHLVEPFRVVLAGAANVGKSSLVNALAGFTRSVVSPVSGTTRDVVTTAIALDGWPVELIDTAGFHESADALDREAMARARAVLGKADLRLWVVDVSAQPLVPPDWACADGIVINKVDLPAIWNEEDLGTSSRALVSCRTGEGLTELCAWIGSLLGLDETARTGEGMAFTPELADQVLEAQKEVRAGSFSRQSPLLAGLSMSPRTCHEH